MRAMRIFLGFAASSALVSAIVAGCGSSSSPTSPVDSGSGDVTMEAMPQMEAAAPEAGPDVMDSAIVDACVPDTSLSSIPVPDAALGEAGATAASCVMCIAGASACQPLVTACNQSCACIGAFEAFSNCLSTPGGSFVACLGDLSSLASFTDAGSTTACGASCLVQCGFSLPTGDGGPPPGDGGADGAGD
jgi:hypothetical protein